MNYENDSWEENEKQFKQMMNFDLIPLDIQDNDDDEEEYFCPSCETGYSLGDSSICECDDCGHEYCSFCGGSSNGCPECGSENFSV